MAGGKSYVTPGFIAAMVVLGASGVVIVVVASIFVSWCLWKYYRYLRQPSEGIAQIRNRIQESDSMHTMEYGSSTRATQRATIGVSPGFIQTLPLLRYSKSGAHLVALEVKGQMSECPVCLNEYKEGERIRFLPNCKHIFHPKCISTWLESHTTCPLCRSDVQLLQKSKRHASLERILSYLRRSEGAGRAQIVDSSTRDDYTDEEPVIPPRHHEPGASLPLPPVSTVRAEPLSRPATRELSFIEAMSSEGIPEVQAGMIFSSVWGPYVDNVHRAEACSSSSAAGFSKVSVKIASSGECSSSAPGFVTISLDADKPER